MKYPLLIFLFLISIQNSKAQLETLEFKSLDLHIEKVMDSLRIPGLQISITFGDSVGFIKGYGYSDVERKLPVNPYESKFQIGSITKVFTAIGVQNAANEGLLALDGEIDNYLDFRIDRPFGDKISLDDLLSHSAGIDELWYNGGYEFTGIESVGAALREIPIKQIRPVGETFSYSNLSVNLAAYILASQTQKPAYQHYRDIVFDPLNLQNTGVFLDRDQADHPMSYYLLGDELVVSPHLRTNLYTSGNVYSTAEDMSKFMRALLNRGTLDSTRSLGSDYLAQIGRRRFAYKEHDEYGSGLGIFITDTKKGKVYSHLGFVEGFASQMYLFENEKVGFFISANSQKGVQGLREVFGFFLKNYLPQYKSDELSASRTDIEFGQYTGNYIPTRTSISGLGRIESLFSTRLRFKESEDGFPYLSAGNQETKLVPVGSNRFVDTTKFIHKTISFNNGSDRMIMNFTVDKGIYAIWPFMRLKWYEEQYVQYPFRILCTLVFLLVPFFWWLRYVLKKSVRKVSAKRILLSMAMLSSVGGFMTFILSSMDFERMQMLSMESLPWQINVFALLNILGLLLTIVALVWVFLNSKQKIKRWDIIVLALLVLTAMNNYIYNSFSIILY